jgi:hypothetical protein
MNMIAQHIRQDILDAFNQGIKRPVIVKQFKVSYLTVYNITNGDPNGRGQQKGKSRKGYDAFYKMAVLRLKAGHTQAEILQEYAGEKPTQTGFSQWIATNYKGSIINGRFSNNKSSKTMEVNIKIVDILTRKLCGLIFFFNGNFWKYPDRKEELIAEMRLVAIQYHHQWDGDYELPDSIKKAAISAADKLKRLLGHYKVEEEKKQRIDALQYSSFDYDCEEGKLLKQLYCAYSLFKMKGVEKIVTPVNPAVTEKYLRQLAGR